MRFVGILPGCVDVDTGLGRSADSSAHAYRVVVGLPRHTG